MALTVVSNAPAATRPDQNGTVFLVPRPLAREVARFVMLPLLPIRPPARPLPAELWSQVFAHLFGREVADQWKELVTVSRAFKDMLEPLVYEHVRLNSPRALEAFTTLLHAADRQWDSIRRIPYSTPGRWVKTLDLSHLSFSTCARRSTFTEPTNSIIGSIGTHTIDALLARLIVLLPFLERLALDAAQGTPSRHALAALAGRDGADRLPSITGLVLPDSLGVDTFSEDAGLDPIVSLLRGMPQLEELGIIGSGLDGADAILDPTSEGVRPPPLDLPKLHTLSAISVPCGPIIHALLHSPLPALRMLTLTPYDNVPGALTSAFLSTHGSSLLSLSLVSPAPSWPTVLYPSPPSILNTCLSLASLSLCYPLPMLLPPPISPSHPLHTLSLPRPSSSILPLVMDAKRLPALHVVRVRDVRWLRAGVAPGARLAGVQGEMREWRVRLARRGVVLLDADGCEAVVTAPVGQRSGR